AAQRPQARRAQEKSDRRVLVRSILRRVEGDSEGCGFNSAAARARADLVALDRLAQARMDRRVGVACPRGRGMSRALARIHTPLRRPSRLSVAGALTRQRAGELDGGCPRA